MLITNLANRVQPLIRYRLDDSFTRAPDAGEHGLLRATLSGRTAHSLRWPGVEIHPLVLGAVLLKHADVIDFQVRQTPSGADVSVLGASTRAPGAGQLQSQEVRSWAHTCPSGQASALQFGESHSASVVAQQQPEA